MTKLSMASLLVALVPTCGVAANVAESAPINLTVDSAASAFWLTVTESPHALPMAYPAGASSATVTVRDMLTGAETVHENVTGATCSISLAEPTSPMAERVYDVSVAYSNGETASIRLGRVASVANGDQASGAWCYKSTAGARWLRLYSSAVVPVPAGASKAYVNGSEVDVGTKGGRGWLQLGPAEIGESCSFRFDVDENPIPLVGAGIGMSLMLK